MKNFRFTIGRRIGLGFGLLIVFIIVIFSMIYVRVDESNKAQIAEKQLNTDINTIYNPSISTLTNLSMAVKRSMDLIEIWVDRDVSRDKEKKAALLELMEQTIPEEVGKISEIKSNWSDEDRTLADSVEQRVNKLLGNFREITDSLLEDPEDYIDFYDSTAQKAVYSFAHLIASDNISDGGPMKVLANLLVLNIDDLNGRMKKKMRVASTQKDENSRKTTEAFNKMLWQLAFLGGALILLAILVGAFTTRSIIRPVTQLKNMLIKMGRGVIPENKMKPTNDEIGEMSIALNSMVDGFRRTTEFSNEVGSGNFNYNYQPLSSEDTLGHALLKMRDDLAENERILEQKVVERTEEVVRQRDELEKQRHKLEELYKDVTDSIRYAKRLQDSILPPERYIKELLPESFVLFKPKDIVSGDFYWFERTDNKVLFAAVDCTGHGVPGAFMSLVGANALNQAVREHNKKTPATIMDDLNKLSSESLNKHDEDSSVRDGMDLAMCAIDQKNLKLEYAGANNPLYIIRNGEILITKADKFAIGSMTGQSYTNHEINLKKGDTIYIFSDGYADQFGGEKGKKFMYKKFRQLLQFLIDKPMSEQKKILDAEIEKWKGSYEQVDDILVIGVKI